MKNEVTALVDFGSTFTKVALVELGTGFLLANGQAHTTVNTDVIEGYEKALNQACAKIFLNQELITPLAASSAGGGLSVSIKIYLISLSGTSTEDRSTSPLLSNILLYIFCCNLLINILLLNSLLG